MDGRVRRNPAPTWLAVIACAAILAGWAGRAAATESGGGAYANGAEGFMTGALPPPGNYFINYLTYYAADRINDGSGNELIPGFDLNVTANVLRFVHVTNKKVLGGSWALHAFVPVLNVDVKVPGLSDDDFGLGDIIVDPFIVGWHTKNFHCVAGLDCYVPTGSYDSTRLANLGRNYWTFEPIFAFTRISDGGFGISGKFMYDLNTENRDIDYTSGQEFHFDYAVGQHVGPWILGVGGYYYQQMTDDDGAAAPPNGFKGRAIAVGPQVSYSRGPKSFVFVYQHELEVKNRPEGGKFWFKFVTPF